MEGDQMKMREALDLIADEAEVIEAYFKRENAPQCLITSVSNIINLARGYRSIPLRQCDVGTPEEQTERHRKFCSDHKFLGSDSSYMCKGFGKGRCPFFNSHTKSQCEFAWAQTPYEAQEGGEK